MSQGTNELGINELITLLENNYGYHRPTAESEVKRLIKEIKRLRTIVYINRIEDKYVNKSV